MKYMPTKVFIEKCRETEENILKEEKLKQNRVQNEIAIIESTRNTVNSIIAENYAKKAKFAEFSASVKRGFLTEAIYKLFNKSLGIHETSNMNNAIKINLVNSYIEENGADALLYDYKYKSKLLSEMSRIVTKYHKMVIESIDKDDVNTFNIEPEFKDNFFDELDMEDFDDVSISIRTRVTDAVNEFIQKNIEDKEELKDIIQDTQDKILNAKTDEIKESFSQMSKAKMTKVRNSRNVNIFEAMVRSLAKGVIEREDLKESYTENGKLDMDRIIESCKIMYTFLETLQTSKMVSIDEEYIENVLLSLKK